MTRARIVLGATGDTAEIELDGHRVEHLARAFRLDAALGDITRLHVDFGLTKGAEFDGDVVVELSQDLRDLLQRLGWRPPD